LQPLHFYTFDHNKSQLNMDPFDAALDLLRRLPPSQTEHYLNKIISLVPDLEEDLVSSVDVGLTTKRCRTSGRDYLCCTYNSGKVLPIKQS
jgi:hypothetical protein